MPDYALMQEYLKQATSALGQLAGMLGVASSPGQGAIAPLPPSEPDYTQYPVADGTPKPDTDPVPDRIGLTMAEWLAFLDDHSVRAVPGALIGYIQYRGGHPANVAFAMASQWGPLYERVAGGALTYCQVLRAIQQGVPDNVPNVTTWDAAARMWRDSTGAPYKAHTEWTSAVAVG